MAPLNATSATILGFLHTSPQSGWELSATIERSVGYFWNVTQSQVYRELKTLAKEGLVEERGSTERSTRYSMTKEGRAAFASWINHAPAPSLMRLPIVLSVFFGEHVDPERLGRFVLSDKLDHQRRLDEYRALLERDHSPFRRATLELGIAYETMMIRWLDELPQGLQAKAPRSSPSAGRRRAKKRA